MKVTEPEQAQRFAVLYKATIDHAVKGAPDLMARLEHRLARWLKRPRVDLALLAALLAVAAPAQSVRVRRDRAFCR